MESMFSDQVKLVIATLVRSENALCLGDFVEATKLPVETIAIALDFLTTIRIFQADNSFHRSEVGEIVYMFASNDQAQDVFNAFAEERSIMTDGEEHG